MKTLLGVVMGLFSALSFAAMYEVRTICGKNDMEPMLNLEASVQSMGHPIGNLRGGGISCTGTMVSNDLFLTARHCKIACSSMTVTFDYLSRQKETFACKEIVEYGNSSSNQDYMFVRLEGAPGVNWGYYALSDRALTNGDDLLIIHHPSGSPMKVSRNSCDFKKEAGGFSYYDCDTEPGSSGSAVMVPDYSQPENTRIIAVHTLGGCNPSSTSYNQGPSIRYLATISPLVRSLIKN